MRRFEQRGSDVYDSLYDKTIRYADISPFAPHIVCCTICGGEMCEIEEDGRLVSCGCDERRNNYYEGVME